MIAKGDIVTHQLGEGKLAGTVVAHVAGPGVLYRVRWDNGRITVARQSDLVVIKQARVWSRRPKAEG